MFNVGDKIQRITGVNSSLDAKFIANCIKNNINPNQDFEVTSATSTCFTIDLPFGWLCGYNFWKLAGPKLTLEDCL